MLLQDDDQVSIRLISQFINGISRVLQKLLKYFNGSVISKSFILLSAGSSACLAAASTPSPVIVILLLTSIYSSL